MEKSLNTILFFSRPVKPFFQARMVALYEMYTSPPAPHGRRPDFGYKMSFEGEIRALFSPVFSQIVIFFHFT
jgi:hypothetical protein